jgi:hypothetical protein
MVDPKVIESAKKIALIIEQDFPDGISYRDLRHLLTGTIYGFFGGET